LATTQALVACKRVLIPVEPSALALPGLVDLDASLVGIRRLEPGVVVAGVLVVRADARTKITGEVTAQLRERWGDLVLDTAIREDVKLKQAPAARQPAYLYAPDSRGALDHELLASELVGRWS
jgi:chromosome partitioning protein